MLKPGVNVSEYDPLAAPGLLPGLVERVRSSPNGTEPFTRTFIARLIYGDTGVLAYIAMDGDRMVAHTIGDIDGRNFIIRQALADPGYPRTIDILLEKLNTWCKDRKLLTIIQHIGPEHHDPSVWEKSYKRYGFTVVEYTVERKVT